ncbi:MAG: hypothetical protein HC794_09325, partial [Nitrospiraceae bacterium]|nr:hypothetical protein [Nitrospiraceae bacterium]
MPGKFSAEIIGRETGYCRGRAGTFHVAAPELGSSVRTPDPSLVGQSVAVAFAVNVDAPGTGTPTGNVTVSDGVASCSATVAAGQCTLALLTVGARNLVASYAGDPSFAASNS